MNDLDLNKRTLLEQCKQLADSVEKASAYNAKELDTAQIKRAALHQYLREQESLIQEMKYHFNIEVLRIRQDMAKVNRDGRGNTKFALPAVSTQPPSCDPAPLDLPCN